MNAVRRVLLRARSRPRDRCGGGARDYSPEDEARSIDWRESACRGVLRIRERVRDGALTWAAIVDSSPSMDAGRARPLICAAAEAAAYWRACAAPGDRWVDVDPSGELAFERSLERALRILPAQSALLAAGDFFDLPRVQPLLLHLAAKRFDCTALFARDPWSDDAPFCGFIVAVDLENGRSKRFFAGRRERINFMRAARERERTTLEQFRHAGWRAASFDENGGEQAVERALGVA